MGFHYAEMAAAAATLCRGLSPGLSNARVGFGPVVLVGYLPFVVGFDEDRAGGEPIQLHRHELPDDHRLRAAGDPSDWLVLGVDDVVREA